MLLGTLSLFSCSRIEVRKESVDALLDGRITIVHISDLHLKKDRKIYDELSEKVNSLDPDLIFITGDSIERAGDLDLLEDFLGSLAPGPRKFACIGNWEIYSGVDGNLLSSSYASHGVTLLINRGGTFRINDTDLYIYGADDWGAGQPLYSPPENGALQLILSHSPAHFDDLILQYPTEPLYVFSGHTHGGQVTFFGKPLFTPHGSGDYVEGVYPSGFSTLFVSKGIGNSTVDFRICATPDIFFVTLE